MDGSLKGLNARVESRVYTRTDGMDSKLLVEMSSCDETEERTQ